MQRRLSQVSWTLRMPRTARLVLPSIPLHITQRGVNRAAIFLDDEDRLHYRRVLHDAFIEHGIALHAYVFMDNHVHMLATPIDAASLGRAMRLSGQHYVQYFNHRHGRSGTLWQGRFKSCLVQDDRHLMQVIRYIELNPVRAAMTTSAEAYRWSSVHAHLGGHDPLLTQHPLFLAIGPTADVRGARHRAWLQEAIDDEEIATIRRYIAQERVLGNPRFQAMVAKTLGQHAEVRPEGRPRLSQTGTE